MAYSRKSESTSAQPRAPTAAGPPFSATVPKTTAAVGQVGRWFSLVHSAQSPQTSHPPPAQYSSVPVPGQARQSPAASCAAAAVASSARYVSAGQSAHVEAPPPLYLPAAQTAHSSFASPAALVPAAQSAQAVAPASAAKVPAGQDAQSPDESWFAAPDADASLLKRPAAHELQSAAAAYDAYLPAAHVWQAELPVPAANVPAPQGAHALAPPPDA